MTRRNFLALGAAVLTTVAGLVGLRRWFAARVPAPRSPIVEDLASHFAYLTFEDETLEAFARAYESHYGPPDLQRPLVRRQLHTQFLMSTDFFQNGADEARALRFVALYDPYITPCYNPLARFD